ncbi:unnamed protein product [Chironomus riparius]|uniref:Uncharacterized protein n=1 Tax=Chironomus riparius TaxID=315576 RepID=A0A9N9WWD6_9DIPT|nr:unnamed protein product [Chironomus riparius]
MSSDEDILQIFHDEEEILDSSTDLSLLKGEILFLKFFKKGSTNIESFIGEIHQLLCEKSVMIKGFGFKGVNSLLIEVLYNDSLRNLLIVLVEARNNTRSLSDKAKNNILKIVFGKFNFIMNNEIINMSVIPNIVKHTVNCRSSFFPYGFYNGNVLNILAKQNQGNPVSLIGKIVSKRANVDKYQKLLAVSLEPISGSEISLRFVLKIDDVCSDLLKTLNNDFGNLTFCTSTVHFIPLSQQDKFQKTIETTSSKEFWSGLSDIDVLFCNKNEQSLAMGRENLNKKPKLKKKRSENSSALVPTSSGSTIFDRLGPNIIIRRTFSTRPGTSSHTSRSTSNRHMN